MRRLLSFVWVLLLSLLTVSCSFWKSEPRARPWLPVLAPAALGQSISVVQKVSGERDGEQIVLLFQLEIQPDRMVVVGSTSGGNTLFSVDYQHEKMTASTSPLLPNKLDPAFVISDLQLAFWPLVAIKNAVAGSSFKVREVSGRRELLQGEKVLVKIDYASVDPWAGRVIFNNLRWNYQYRIDTLQREAIEPATNGPKIE